MATATTQRSALGAKIHLPPPIPADIANRIRKLQAEAWAERIDGPGNARHAALLAQARDLADAARGLL